MTKKYTHITLSERTLIQTQLQLGFTPAAIAESLGRHRSSVTLELARNGWNPASIVRSVGHPAIAGGYSSRQASLRAKKTICYSKGSTQACYWQLSSRECDRRGQIPNMTSIDQRPADIAERLVPGHWEGDHIKGAANRSQVGTLVERKTRFVALVKLSNGTAQATTEGFGTILQRFEIYRSYLKVLVFKTIC